MKIASWSLVIIIGLPTMLLIMLYAASELGGEVVTLERPNSDGSKSLIRIWIVDQDDSAWIEHGDYQSDWITKLSESSEITLTRQGETLSYWGTTDPEFHLKYHKLRREKYGWADDFIALLSGGNDHCNGVPVRLLKKPHHQGDATR